MQVVANKKDMIEEIRVEYQKIKGKTQFIIELSESVGRAKRTIRNHWFGGFWDIPIDFQTQVLELITNKIKSQDHEKSI